MILLETSALYKSFTYLLTYLELMFIIKYSRISQRGLSRIRKLCILLKLLTQKLYVVVIVLVCLTTVYHCHNYCSYVGL